MQIKRRLTYFWRIKGAQDGTIIDHNNRVSLSVSGAISGAIQYLRYGAFKVNFKKDEQIVITIYDYDPKLPKDDISGKGKGKTVAVEILKNMLPVWRMRPGIQMEAIKKFEPYEILKIDKSYNVLLKTDRGLQLITKMGEIYSASTPTPIVKQ